MENTKKNGHEGCGCGGHEHKHEGSCCGSHNHEHHHHKHGGGCCGGHGHHDHEHEDHDHGKIYLETESGEELECDVLGIFEFEGQEYIALIPVDDETAYLYRYSEIEDEPALGQIESDEEYDKVSEHFMQLVDSEEEE